MALIPNLLTLLRILLIPLFLYLVFFSQFNYRITIALIVFTLGALTDFLDGYLARKWKVISDFGKIADPLADKLLVLSALAGLTWLEPFRLFVLIFILIALREAAITILREVYKARGIIVPADKLGKVKTFLQMTGIIAAYIIWIAHPHDLPRFYTIAAHVWFGLVAALTIYSGALYLKPQTR